MNKYASIKEYVEALYREGSNQVADTLQRIRSGESDDVSEVFKPTEALRSAGFEVMPQEVTDPVLEAFGLRSFGEGAFAVYDMYGRTPYHKLSSAEILERFRAKTVTHEVDVLCEFLRYHQKK